jgi:hypothetical protein
MFSEKKYRAKSNEYGDLIKGSNDPGRIREFQDSKDSFSSLTDNEEWLANNFDKMVQAPAEEKPGHITLVAEEERVLRCLGAAVIMQSNTLPAKLQRELFDTAGSMGDLLDTAALRRQIARFLHKHKDDEPEAQYWRIIPRSRLAPVVCDRALRPFAAQSGVRQWPPRR